MIATGSTYRERAETEARARIFWGDQRDDVVRHLTDNGVAHEEAGGIVESFVHERADTIRKMGMKKLLIGGALVGALFTPWFAICIITHRFFMPPLMIACLPGSVGVYGAFSLLKGAQLYLMPDSEMGDIAEKD
jgi:hypothetical protein